MKSSFWDKHETELIKSGTRYRVIFDFGNFEITTYVEIAHLSPEDVKLFAMARIQKELVLLNGNDDLSSLSCCVEVLE